ncbi:MaoC/PaaZ C-terminal domain-containing protein [Micromonospora sp. NPDC050200]|uniref:MaoC/PaaZ C-terminal domain-containing protein n=1 Tax=Micromonospora sp. NPDC050200 TaxID=3155664 RepID=UPI00340DCAD7
MSVPAAPAPWTVGPVTRTDFVRYQGASGDMNPIHHDEEFARAAGFPTPFSVGMWQAGLLGTYATDWLGAENVRGFRIRFLEQVWPGDTLTCHGEVLREYEQDGERRVDVELTCRRQTGGTAVTVWSTFVVPDAAQPEQEATHVA